MARPHLSITVWRKCLMGENFDEFDESRIHHQNFPYQYTRIAFD